VHLAGSHDEVDAVECTDPRERLHDPVHLQERLIR